MKICKKCNSKLPLDNFSEWINVRGKKYRRGSCKKCLNNINLEYWKTPKGKAARSKVRRKHKDKCLQEFRDLKEASPCVDCGTKYPYYIMQWDHVKGTKVKAVSALLTQESWDRAREEIKKCELVCSNCHAERTFKRGKLARSSTPEAQRTLIKLAESIPYESLEKDVIDNLGRLDKILEGCYNGLQQLKKPQSRNESEHTLANLLEECCCAQWIARTDSGDYCPDCAEHKGMVGTNRGEIIAVVGPKIQK
jgi:hypothetical protein